MGKIGNSYSRCSRKYARSKEEKEQLKSDLRLLNEENVQRLLTRESDCDTIARAILDSSLIFQTRVKKYRFKVIECGDYYRVYDFYNYRVKNNNLDKIPKVIRTRKIELKKEPKWGSQTTLFDSGAIYHGEKINVGPTLCGILRVYKIDTRSRGDPIADKKLIEVKNINRAKNAIQCLIKANENEFKTFVTLTFAENVKNIDLANKRFNSWRTYIKKLKNDFKYVCVPEFQKRGAVHYHLLTNIDYTDFDLLSKEEITTYSIKSKSYDVGRTIVGWNDGFSKVKSMDDVNVVGYLTKYLTKDIDNRLWGKRRYLYSRNLIKPTISYLNLDDIKDFSMYMKILDSEVCYENIYCDKLGQLIQFKEYKKVLNIGE